LALPLASTAAIRCTAATMAFLDLVTPRDPAFRSEALAIRMERADLQRAFPTAESADFARWLLIHGLLEYPERLGRFLPPLPPAELRRTACGATDAAEHLRSGLDDAEAIHDLALTFVDRPLASGLRVLDFGCACGRLARWLPSALPNSEVSGSDVRTAAADWCAANLRGTFRPNAIEPPLPFPDQSFDLVVSLSVFTHLTRASNERWIRELVRVTKPDGRLLLSMLGTFALFVIQRMPHNQAVFEMSAEQARDYARRLANEHWLLHPTSPEILAGIDGVEAGYGQAFNDETFVRTAWAPWVDVVGVVPAGQGLFQDFYALRPRRR
jgi:2-polyprenyl-3-methyl-5-hydroxy-6-metoxy-1,4-benzoquinol methylase